MQVPVSDSDEDGRAENAREECMEIRVYRYGLGDPVDWEDDCREHLLLQVRFWNVLVGIEETFREGCHRILSQDPTVAKVYSQIEKVQEIQRKLRARRSELRQQARRRLHIESIDKRLRELSREIQLFSQLATAADICARSTEDVREALKTLGAKRGEAVKLARKQSGLWWGNYNAVWKSYQRARGVHKTGKRLKFHRFTGDGRFTVQIIGGTTVDDVLTDQCSELAIDLTPAAVPRRAGKKARNPRTSLRGRPIGALPARQGRSRPRLSITVYTNGRRGGGMQRRTLTFPLMYDRPLPADARIQEAIVTRRRVGTRFRYHVAFSLRVPNRLPVAQSPSKCGINLGFRTRADGSLRIAMLADDHGSHEYTLPAKWMRQMDRVEEIQQKRDDLLNEITALLRERWSARPEGTPDELEERMGDLVRAPAFGQAKLAMLVIRWREDWHYWSEMMERLEAWRKEDKHWLEIQSNMRDRLLANRLDQYCLLARDIVSRYGEVRLGEIRLSETAQLERADGSQTELHQRARRNRVRASLSQLRVQLCHQANKVGCVIWSVAGAFTRRCHSCGGECAVTEELMYTCEHCGSRWDQDANAANNILDAEPGERSRTAA